MDREPIPIVIDCDNTMGRPGAEIDDGLAIIYLLGRPEVNLLGITTTFGNGPTAEVTRLTRELVERLGLPIPVYEGATSPTASGPRAGEPVSPAVRFLAESSNRFPGRLVVVALGALTNLADAEAYAPGFLAGLGSVWCMGGYLRPLRFLFRPVHELNLSSDPIAAREVLAAACPVVLMSAQVCLAARFGVRHLLASARAARRGRIPAWLHVYVAQWFWTFSRWAGIVGFYLWDLLPVVGLVEPSRFAGRLLTLDVGPAELADGWVVRPETDVRGREEPLAGLLASAAARGRGVIVLPTRIRTAHRFSADVLRGWEAAFQDRNRS